MNNAFVKKCFEEYAKRENTQYRKSSIKKENIEKLQNKYNVTFPSIYIDFISLYAHEMTELQGNLDNYLFEDDVDVILEIPPQPYQKELEMIELLYESHIKLLNCGYLPIGEFDGYNLLYLDLQSGKIYFIDEDDYYECDEKEQIAENSFILFNDFTQLLECFFLKKTHVCEE